MPFPATYDTGQVQPWYIGDSDNGAGTAAALVANTTYLVAITVAANVTVTAIRARYGAGGSGTATGGLYDSNGNLLASSAATTSATGVNTFTFTSSVSIAPGRYYLALWVSNATDTIFRYSSASSFTEGYTVTATGAAIAASFTPSTGLTQAAQKVILLGIISGGIA